MMMVGGGGFPTELIPWNFHDLNPLEQMEIQTNDPFLPLNPTGIYFMPNQRYQNHIRNKEWDALRAKPPINRRTIQKLFERRITPEERQQIEVFWKDLEQVSGKTRDEIGDEILNYPRFPLGVRSPTISIPRVLPKLNGTNAGEMLNDAYGRIMASGLNPKGKADLLEGFLKQIEARNPGWEFNARFTGTDGSHIFVGPGNAVVISPKGNIFTGSFPGNGFSVRDGISPNYNLLKPK